MRDRGGQGQSKNLSHASWKWTPPPFFVSSQANIRNIFSDQKSPRHLEGLTPSLRARGEEGPGGDPKHEVTHLENDPPIFWKLCYHRPILGTRSLTWSLHNNQKWVFLYGTDKHTDIATLWLIRPKGRVSENSFANFSYKTCCHNLLHYYYCNILLQLSKSPLPLHMSLRSLLSLPSILLLSCVTYPSLPHCGMP